MSLLYLAGGIVSTGKYVTLASTEDFTRVGVSMSVLGLAAVRQSSHDVPPGRGAGLGGQCGRRANASSGRSKAEAGHVDTVHENQGDGRSADARGNGPDGAAHRRDDEVGCTAFDGGMPA